MNSRTITLGLAVIIFLLFTLFFISQNLILDRGHRIEGVLNNLIQAVKEKDWTTAEKSLIKFNNIWNKVRYLVALNNAEQDFSDMSDAVENLRAAIEIRDQHRALENARQISNYWENFRSLVPEP